MSFSAPTNWAAALKPIFIGVAVACVIHFTQRSNLPHVGDQGHSLPHGGIYRDGTKAVNYYSPNHSFPRPGLLNKCTNSLGVLSLISILIIAIIVNERVFNRGRRVCVCTSCSRTSQ